jgi:hypothetical protein
MQLETEPSGPSIGNAQAPSVVQLPLAQSDPVLQSGRQKAVVGVNVKQRLPDGHLPFDT